MNEPLPDSEIEKLAKRFDMDASSLRIELANVKASIADLRGVIDKQTNRKQTKAILKSIRGHAVALRKLIQGPSPSVKFAIEVGLEDTMGKDEDDAYEEAASFLPMLVQQLETLERSSDSKYILDPNRPGTPGLTAVSKQNAQLVLLLALTWERQTGRKATYASDQDSGQRSGDFVEFMTAAARLMGIYPAPLPELFRRQLSKHPEHFGRRKKKEKGGQSEAKRRGDQWGYVENEEEVKSEASPRWPYQDYLAKED